ncbi:MAG: phosphate ABC transporter ATP-binding protein [Anaerolineae bacterium]|nr:phosphate ABC transporter ATP-binding protein [Anaerolineae bacterium]
MSDPIYTLEGVTKVYEGNPVLRVEQLEVERGEVLALVGPSGAGKSTLLRLLNFLEPPTFGRLTFMGSSIAPGQEAPLQLRRRVTTVFQQSVLLNRSVRDNVAFGLRLRGRRDSSDRVDEALEMVRLSHLQGRRARTLSGGEAQRVALARALVLEPDVLLLDEPTANLDPANVCLIEEAVRSRNREKGTTVILVTHNVFQARRLADRVGLLLSGRLVEVAETEAFFGAPQDPRTQAFVSGEMVY